MDHELAFVRSFIIKSKQSRYLEKLGSSKHRREFLSRLHHSLDYDPRLAELIPPSRQTSELIFAKLRELGAPEICHVIAASAVLDGRDLPLRDVLSDIYAMGNGVVLSCIPGKLAYYESEEPNGRFILVHS